MRASERERKVERAATRKRAEPLSLSRPALEMKGSNEYMPRQVQETRKGIHLIQGSLKFWSDNECTLLSSRGRDDAAAPSCTACRTSLVAGLSDVSFLFSLFLRLSPASALLAAALMLSSSFLRCSGSRALLFVYLLTLLTAKMLLLLLLLLLAGRARDQSRELCVIAEGRTKKTIYVDAPYSGILREKYRNV